MYYFKNANGVKLKPPKEGKDFFKDLHVHYSVKLNQDEISLFYSAMIILFNYCKSNDYNIIGWNGLNILFTLDGNFEVDMDDEHIGGAYMKIVVYNVNNWRIHDNNAGLIMSIYLEELCHYYFNISDEIEVKHKVYEIMKNFNPNFTFEEYLKSIGMEGML